MGDKNKPEVTFSDGTHALGPYDFATIYNSPVAASSGLMGSGVTIGIVGRNDLYGASSASAGSDVSDFRTQLLGGSFTGTFQIIYNGPDPGDAGGGEEAEATLDTTWSGAVAPNAIIDLVVSGSTNTTDGIDLSEVYVIENNLADIMSESFGSCESGQSAAEPGISALAEQAAAQGITYFVSTGDAGAEGCDDPNSETVATGPVSVNILASTPFNVAVGGTMFNEGSNVSAYWGAAGGSINSGTALSYIPEDVWNESCSSTNCPSGSSPNISAGGGGASVLVAQPPWQSGVAGLPLPSSVCSGITPCRLLPDVALTAAFHDAYLLCLEASCVPNSQNLISIYLVWGTSASAPSFAGIQALIDAQMASGGGSLRQGLANYPLYKLAATENSTLGQCNATGTTLPASACIFNDVTTGNNAVPGEVNYGLSTAQYQAGIGYDLASGLGSVNITNLIKNWNTVTFNPSQTTLTLNGGTAVNITHGQSVSVSVAVAPTPPTTTPIPTGEVVLLTSSTLAPSTLNQFSLSGGQATGSTTSLPGSGPSSYTVWAHYGGDSTYASSESTKVSVTVGAEPSTTTLSLQATDLNGNPVSSPFPFGSIVFVRADVAGKSGFGVPTGSVAFTDTLGALPTLNPQTNPPVVVSASPAVNSQGNTSIGDGIISFDEGNHSISGVYGGDASFTTSSSTTPVTFTVASGFAIVSGFAPVTISAPGATTSNTTTVGIVASSKFTSAISFTCSGLPSEATCSPASATGKGPTTIVNTTITINTTAPTAMLRSKERRYYYAVLLSGGLPLAGIFVIGAPRRRRWTTLLGLMFLMAFLVAVPGCGGGGSGSGQKQQQNPGTPAGTYTVTLTATAGSIVESGTFTLTVQ